MRAVDHRSGYLSSYCGSDPDTQDIQHLPGVSFIDVRRVSWVLPVLYAKGGHLVCQERYWRLPGLWREAFTFVFLGEKQPDHDSTVMSRGAGRLGFLIFDAIASLCLGG